MVNFVAAVAYHSCLALPAAFTQPGAHLLAEPPYNYFLSQIGTWSDVRARSGERNGLKITRNPLVGAGYLPKQTGKSE